MKLPQAKPLRKSPTRLGDDGAKPVFAQKPSFSRVAPPEVIEQLAMCDIVITGLGG